MADIGALVAGDANAFEALLQMLMSTQNEQRAHAEQVFTELRKHGDACVSQLVRSLRSSPNVESRGLCAVLLRKVAKFKNVLIITAFPPRSCNLLSYISCDVAGADSRR